MKASIFWKPARLLAAFGSKVQGRSTFLDLGAKRIRIEAHRAARLLSDGSRQWEALRPFRVLVNVRNCIWFREENCLDYPPEAQVDQY